MSWPKPYWLIKQQLRFEEAEQKWRKKYFTFGMIEGELEGWYRFRGLVTLLISPFAVLLVCLQTISKLLLPCEQAAAQEQTLGRLHIYWYHDAAAILPHTS